jgi:hypothetical protein
MVKWFGINAGIMIVVLTGCSGSTRLSTRVNATELLKKYMDDAHVDVVSSGVWGPDLSNESYRTCSGEYVVRIDSDKERRFVREYREGILKAVSANGGEIDGTGEGQSKDGDITAFCVTARFGAGVSFIAVHCRQITDRSGANAAFITLTQVDW